MATSSTPMPFHCWRCGALMQVAGPYKESDGWECWRCGAYIAPDRTAFLPAADQIRLFAEYRAEVGL